VDCTLNPPSVPHHRTSISEILGFPLDPLGLAHRVGPVDHTTKLLHLIFYGADELVDGEVAEDAADVCIWKPIRFGSFLSSWTNSRERYAVLRQLS
jgi:hypothetical protein